MNNHNDPYDPTHALLMGLPIVGTTTYDQIVVQAIRAGASVAGRLRVEVEAEWIRQDFPDALEQLDKRLDRSIDGDTTVYDGPATADAVNALEPLIEIRGGEGQRVYGIRSIRLAVEGDRCLEYVPEHRSFTIDARAANGLDGAIHDALADEPAGLIECRPLAEWKYEGTEYSVAPPWLCVGATCNRLTRLEAIDPDPRNRRIKLTWYTTERGRLGRVLGRLAEQIGVAKPPSLSFDSHEAFESGRSALEEVVSITGGARDYA